MSAKDFTQIGSPDNPSTASDAPKPSTTPSTMPESNGPPVQTHLISN